MALGVPESKRAPPGLPGSWAGLAVPGLSPGPEALLPMTPLLHVLQSHTQEFSSSLFHSREIQGNAIQRMGGAGRDMIRWQNHSLSSQAPMCL